MKPDYLLTVTAFTFTALATLTINTSYADSTVLTAKPDKCVSLRKGQLCYQRINLSWSAEINGRYCIMASNQTEPLKCWSNSTTGKIAFPLESTENINFQLINRPEGQSDNSTNAVLSTATVTIAWVYNTKSRNRTTWRLF